MKKKKLSDLNNTEYTGSEQILSRQGSAIAFLDNMSLAIPRSMRFNLNPLETKILPMSFSHAKGLLRIEDGHDGGSALILTSHSVNGINIIATNNLLLSNTIGTGDISIYKKAYGRELFMTNNSSIVRYISIAAI